MKGALTIIYLNYSSKLFSLFLSIFLLNISIGFGQTKSSYNSEQTKVSDNPILRLSDEKKGWAPIPIPKIREYNQKNRTANFSFVVKYNLETKTSTHSN